MHRSLHYLYTVMVFSNESLSVNFCSMSYLKVLVYF
jgi:hypothetical protein